MAQQRKTERRADHLRILLIDPSDTRAAALETVLHQSGNHEVLRYLPADDILAKVAEVEPDIVLVEIDDPQRDIIEQLTTLRDRRPTPVAVFCQNAAAQSIQSAVESGVCAYVVEGVHPEQVQPAISLAMATFSAYRKFRDEAAQARAALEDRKKIDRAKRLLMTTQNLSENDAYQAIKKLAMSRQRKLAEAADDLVAVAKLFGGKG